MKKLTAFQWYIKQHNIIARYDISVEERFKLFDEIIEKTKQMEKEQIEKAWWAGCDESLSNHIIHPSEDCNGYYNETYGGNK